MSRHPSLFVLSLLAVGTVVAAQSVQLTAQTGSTFDWRSQDCDGKTAAYAALSTEQKEDVLEVLVVRRPQDILDEVMGVSCAFMGQITPIGYIQDEDLTVDGVSQESLYLISGIDWYFVTDTPTNSIGYAFQTDEEPYEYLGRKEAALLEKVAFARADREDFAALAEAYDLAQNADGDYVFGDSRQAVAGSAADQGESSPQTDAESSAEETMESAGSSTAASPSSAAQENQEDLFRQIEQLSNESSSAEPRRAFYRDGKVVRYDTPDADADTSVDSPTDAIVPLPVSPSSSSADPIVEQLMQEQEEFLSENDEGEGEENGTGEEGDGENGTGEEGDGETNTEGETEQRPAAPEGGGGIGMATILSGGAAIVLGIGFALFMLLRKKKRSASAEDAPPTAQGIAEGPQQKSARLEKALSAMDEDENSNEPDS